MKKIIIIGLVVLIAACAGLFLYYSKQRNNTVGTPVESVVVTRKTIEGSVTTKGNVELMELETVAAESQAKILNVNVKVGDMVKAGDVLIEYDPKSKEKLEESLTEAQLALRSAELTLAGASMPPAAREIANAEAEVAVREKSVQDGRLAIERADITIQGVLNNLNIARSDYEKKNLLFESGIIPAAEREAAVNRVSELELSLENSKKSKEALELELGAAIKSENAARQSLEYLENRSQEPSVQNQIALAEVSVQQQKLRISQISKQLEEFKLFETSPIDGSVINVLVQNGYVTQPGDRLMNLGDTSRLIIVTEVVEYDVPSLSIGQQVELTGETLRNETIAGEIISIAPSAVSKQIGNATGNVVRTEIGLLEENTILKPGFSVTAKILTTSYENAIAIPLLSLLYDKDGEYSVFVIAGDNTVERRRVSILNFAALDAVVEGVSEGERIVASPPVDLEEGAVVSYDD